MGLRIFLHSIKLVFAQFGAALKISALLYIVSMILGGIGFYYQFQAMASGQPNAVAWQFFVAAFLSFVPYLWIAVGWHRFVLLDEMPRAPLPTPPGDRLWSYVGRALQMVLVFIVFGLGVGLVLTIAMMVSNASPWVAFPLMIGAIAFAVLITYRLAPIFPGAAIGRPIGIGEAWNATSGGSGALLLMAIISAIASFLLDLPVEILSRLPWGQFTSIAWIVVTYWIKLMVGVSILTTIYGVYVEKRAIA